MISIVGTSFRRSLRGGFMVAVAKVRHQSGYGISLNRGRVGHTGRQFNPRQKKIKSGDTIRPSALPLRVEQPERLGGSKGELK